MENAMGNKGKQEIANAKRKQVAGKSLQMD